MSNLKHIWRRLDSVIRSSSSSDSEIAICTDWVLVAEFTDGEGHLWLESWKSENLSTWKRRGMMDTITYYESEE